MTRQALEQLALVGVFAGAGVGAARLAEIPLAGPIARATGRATLQLLVVGALLSLVVNHGWLVVIVAGVMLSTATWTAAGRVRIPRLWPWLGLAIGLPAAGAAAALLGAGAVPGGALSSVATVGILIGGAMSAVSLTGRALTRETVRDSGGIEARLCLGQSVREATAGAVRHAVVSGLVPALDQTRTVGLIALPGTFVGLVLGGATPATAARIQLLVLVGLLAVELVAAVLAARAIIRALTVRGAERLRPVARSGEE